MSSRGRADNAAYYDAFSDTYERRRRRGYHRFLDDGEAALALRYCRPSDRVLELGCGTGLVMERIRPHVRSIEGVDVSPGMLAHARAKGLTVHEAGVERLPFADGAFDVACSFKVLAHVERVDVALREARRVLRGGGVGVFEFYNPASLRALRKRLFAGTVAPGLAEDRVFTRFDDAGAARRRVEEAGFRVLGLHGLIVLTPFAAAHAAPLVGGALRALERAASRSPLGRFGGFLTVAGRAE